MNKKYIIYSISDPLTNEIRYIGSTINFNRRINQHNNDKRNSKKCIWMRSLKDQGLNPVYTILEECTELNWKERERYWISKFDNLTNHKLGGDSGNPRIVSKETRNKLRDINKGKVLSSKHKVELMNSANSKKLSVDGIIYNSAGEASRKLNIHSGTIAGRCRSQNYVNYFYITE